MSNRCSQIMLELTDIFYDEKDMTIDVQKHLQNCHKCREHWDYLNASRQKFYLPDTEALVDNASIQQAFLEADKRIKQQKEIRDFIIFIILVLLIMSAAVLTAFYGYGGVVILIQGTLTFLTTIIIPLAVIRKLYLEDDIR